VHARVTRDIGFGGTTSFTVRLRLNRVNAPKLTTRRGAAAKAYVETTVLGARVDITTTEPYKYGGPHNSPGEWMAEIVLPDGSNLSDLLMTQGLAVAWDGDGERPADV
jgi:endonuclease YncB( thermonuclease family)